MNICFPVRDLNGKEFTSVDEVMGLINGEAHGSWLLGANGLWHGGIHISDITQPFAALNKEARNMGDPMPVQFMADGTIVAYRLNDSYQTTSYCSKPLRFSTSFVLVKSVCKPAPQKQASWLEFYTLYMHLAAVDDYPTSPCYKVSRGHNGISLRKYVKGHYGEPDDEAGAEHSAAHNAPPPATGANRRALLVNDGDRFVVSRTGRFYVTRNKQTTLLPFGLARLLKDGKPSGSRYWVTLDPELVEQDGELHDLMPAWMEKATARGTYNGVVNTGGGEAWQVRAGTPVGFMGLNEIPGVRNTLVEQERFVHLEVLSVDDRMPAFLSNPASVTTAGKLVRTTAGKTIHLRLADSNPPVFQATSVTLSSGALASRESTAPVKDAEGKAWFKVCENGWVPQGDVEEIEQYDLLKQGFYPMEENSGGDVMESVREGWLPEAFGQIADLTGEAARLQAARVPEYYRRLIAKMDEDNAGKVTADEIRRALGRCDPQVRDIVDRLVVKHHSEWIGGPSLERWKGFYNVLDKLSVPYCTTWQSGQEWMSQVDVFKGDKPVWHMHPVKFLNSLKERRKWFDIPLFVEKYKIKHQREFGSYDKGVKVTISGLNTDSEESLNRLLEEMERQYYTYFDYFNGKYISYMLATIRVESYNYMRGVYFKPAIEVISYNQAEIDYGSGPTATNSDRRKAILNHNTNPGDGYRYRGRGLVQLTWKINYEKFMRLTGIDIVTNPDLCTELTTAVSIMMDGMKNGGFREGHTLSRYLGESKRDYFNARLIINGYRNGIPDKADEFEDYAERFEEIINEIL